MKRRISLRKLSYGDLVKLRFLTDLEILRKYGLAVLVALIIVALMIYAQQR